MDVGMWVQHCEQRVAGRHCHSLDSGVGFGSAGRVNGLRKESSRAKELSRGSRCLFCQLEQCVHADTCTAAPSLPVPGRKPWVSPARRLCLVNGALAVEVAGAITLDPLI